MISLALVKLITAALSAVVVVSDNGAVYRPVSLGCRPKKSNVLRSRDFFSFRFAYLQK